MLTPAKSGGGPGSSGGDFGGRRPSGGADDDQPGRTEMAQPANDHHDDFNARDDRGKSDFGQKKQSDQPQNKDNKVKSTPVSTAPNVEFSLEQFQALMAQVRACMCVYVCVQILCV
jgi:hypothetical protein